MTTIKKKIWPEYFEAVLSGKKKKEDDMLVLEEYDPNTKQYSGRSIDKKVTYVGKFKVKDLFWPENEIKEKGLQIISM